MNYKIKEKIQLFTGLAVIVISAITLFVFYSNEDEIVPYQWFWESVLFFTMTLPFIIFKLSDKKSFKKADNDNKNNKPKKTKRIRVDLSKCKIESNASYFRNESNNQESTSRWEGAYPSKNIITNTKVTECVLVIDLEKNGENVRFTSETIFKDEVTLSFLLEQKKMIDLYIQPNGNYFFDLDFLD
jgi:hypothetical protein